MNCLEFLITININFLNLKQKLRKIHSIPEWVLYRFYQLLLKMIHWKICVNEDSWRYSYYDQQKHANTIHNLDIWWLFLNWSQFFKLLKNFILGFFWLHLNAMIWFYIQSIILRINCLYIAICFALLKISNSNHSNWNSEIYGRQYWFSNDFLLSSYFLFLAIGPRLVKLVVSEDEFIWKPCSIEIQN